MMQQLETSHEENLAITTKELHLLCSLKMKLNFMSKRLIYHQTADLMIQPHHKLHEEEITGVSGKTLALVQFVVII